MQEKNGGIMSAEKVKHWKDKIKLCLMKEYFFVMDCPIINQYIFDIQKMFTLISPMPEIQVRLHTMHIVNECIFIFGALIFLLKYSGENMAGMCLMSLGFLYVICNQIVTRHIEKEDYRLLKQLEKYLGDVRHYYHTGGLVEEAIYDSLEEAPYEISLHMQKIYELLITEDLEELQQYKDTAPNKYLTTFTALCQITIQYGDTIQDSSSLFLANLNHLKQEIHMELLKRDRIHHTFSGLILLVLLPVFFLKPIEKWGIANLPELEKFYAGKYGTIVSVIIFSITMLFYTIICRLRGEGKILKVRHRFLEWLEKQKIVNYILSKWMYRHLAKVHKLDRVLKRNIETLTVKQYLIKCGLLFAVTMFSMNLLFVYTTMTTKYNLIHYTKEFKGASPVISKENIEYNQILLEEIVDEMRKIPSEKWKGELKKKVKMGHCKGGEMEEKQLYQEIMERLLRYEQSGFKWYYTLISLFFALIMGIMPRCLLELKSFFLYAAMEEEVMQFHSILLMLREIPRMNVEILLEWLEMFGVIFQQSIMECVDYYSFDNEGALKRLKEQEPFLPFVRLVENLEACDRIGIRQAFDELAGQRNYYLEKRKQDNEIMISNKGAIGKVMAYIPMILVIGLYLILPFILESLSQLSGYMSQMNRMM